MNTDAHIRGEAAFQYFTEGYNCAQSVTLAFADLVPVPRDTLCRMASSFGGGMGRLREVCGAVSAMFLITGLLYGYDTPESGDIKKEHYARIQTLAKRFEAEKKSIICRELLGLSEHRQDPAPEARTAQYYETRPCPELVCFAAELLSEYISDMNSDNL